jgi:alkylation response protein AidB-like acyl-CoA dehydrogenase
MDWNDNAEQAAFRAEVGQLIAERLPDFYRERATHDLRDGSFPWQTDSTSDDPVRREAADAWFAAVAEKSWVAAHWPSEYGGGGLSAMEQYILKAEMATRGAPPVGSNVGTSMLGPTLIVHGTDEQKARFLPSILKGEGVWAQGFSEPGAGSDLAALSTRAVRDGDEYVVNGQKIWTSFGHYASWIALLVRTDPDAPKHRGISLLLSSIKAPGVTVRPLIDAAWGHHINETFFEDVRVPADQIVGEENRGWYVAMTLLDNERSNITGAIELRRRVGRLAEHVTGVGAPTARLRDLDSVRQEIAERAVEAEVMLGFSLRIVTIQASGGVPNYEASVAKMFGSEAGQRMDRTGMKAFGLYANLWDPEDARAPMEASFTHDYVRSIPSTIAAGSSEIQRNVIATRGLGLPRG